MNEYFLNLIRDYVLKSILPKMISFKLGSVPDSFVSGRPTILFDEDEMPSVRTYPYLASYSPQAGDRVLLAVVGNGAVILGKII